MEYFIMFLSFMLTLFMVCVSFVGVTEVLKKLHDFEKDPTKMFIVAELLVVIVLALFDKYFGLEHPMVMLLGVIFSNFYIVVIWMFEDYIDKWCSPL